VLIAPSQVPKNPQLAQSAGGSGPCLAGSLQPSQGYSAPWHEHAEGPDLPDQDTVAFTGLQYHVESWVYDIGRGTLLNRSPEPVLRVRS
jgi:hypothetical protein